MCNGAIIPCAYLISKAVLTLFFPPCLWTWHFLVFHWCLFLEKVGKSRFCTVKPFAFLSGLPFKKCGITALDSGRLTVQKGNWDIKIFFKSLSMHNLSWAAPAQRWLEMLPKWELRARFLYRRGWSNAKKLFAWL